MIITAEGRKGEVYLALPPYFFSFISLLQAIGLQINVVKKSGRCSQQDRPSKNASRILSRLSQLSTLSISTANLRNAGVAVAIS
jgi:hypothetical protein